MTKEELEKLTKKEIIELYFKLLEDKEKKVNLNKIQSFETKITRR